MEEIKVKSLFKAMRLLDYFTVNTPEFGISELATMSGMCKSSVHNIVSTFIMCDFLTKTSHNKYRLGTKILQLSNSLYLSNDLRNLVRPFLEKVCSDIEESVYFGISSDLEVIYLDAVTPNEMMSSKSIIGIKAPLYCTGIGKALLSNLSAEEVNQVVKRGLQAFTPNTITNKQSLIEDLEKTKLRGYAIDNMEHEYGIRCVAVPIKNIKNDVVAAISVSGPSLRFEEDTIKKYAEILLNYSIQLKNIIP